MANTTVNPANSPIPVPNRNLSPELIPCSNYL